MRAGEAMLGEPIVMQPRRARVLDRPAHDAGEPRRAANLDAHLRDYAALPEKGEQRQQRQAENGEIIALDAGEELGAKTLELVGADRAQRGRAGAVEIRRDDRGGRGPHGRRPRRSDPPDLLTALDDRDGADQLVGAARERCELARGRGAVRRLVEPFAAAGVENLVGADDERIGMARSHRLGLTGRELDRDRLDGGAVAPHVLFHLALVDRGRIDGHREPGIAEEGAPDRACRGQHQRLGHDAGVSRRSAISCMIAAAVSSIERRDTSSTGQPWRAKSWRAAVTSPRTVSMSVYEVSSVSLIIRSRLRRTWTSEAGSQVKPTTSGAFRLWISSGGGTPGTMGTFAALMPRLAR